MRMAMAKSQYIVTFLVLACAMVSIAEAIPSSDASSNSAKSYSPTASPKPTTMPVGPLRSDDSSSLTNPLAAPLPNWNLAWSVRLNKDGQVVASDTKSQQAEQRPGLSIPEPGTVAVLLCGAGFSLFRRRRTRR